MSDKQSSRGQQNVEFLAMLENKYGHNHEQVRDFFYSYFGREVSSFIHPLQTITVSEIGIPKMENFRKILIDMLVMD